jgi:hypothetical protein
MISSRLVTDILWILPLALQAAVMFAIVRRKLLRTFPLFFTYTVAVLSREIVLMFLRNPGKLYGQVYWYGEVLNVFLSLGAIFETLRQVLPPYPFLSVMLKAIWTLGGVTAVAATLLLLFSHAGAGGDRVLAMIMLAERSARFVEACWLIVVIALVSYFERGWQQYSVGIVAGFGIYSALALALFEFRAHLHLLSYATFAVLNSAAYNLAAIIWALYFLRPRRILQLGHLPKTNLSDWNNAVTEYFTQQWSRRY